MIYDSTSLLEDYAQTKNFQDGMVTRTQAQSALTNAILTYGPDFTAEFWEVLRNQPMEVGDITLEEASQIMTVVPCTWEEAEIAWHYRHNKQKLMLTSPVYLDSICAASEALLVQPELCKKFGRDVSVAECVYLLQRAGTGYTIGELEENERFLDTHGYELFVPSQQKHDDTVAVWKAPALLSFIRDVGHIPNGWITYTQMKRAFTICSATYGADGIAKFYSAFRHLNTTFSGDWSDMNAVVGVMIEQSIGYHEADVVVSSRRHPECPIF